MADRIGTRFGVLGREWSLAVLYAAELTAREGVDALDRANRRVHAGTADGLAPAETPGQRWRMLLESLFPTSTMLIDRHTPPPVELGDLDGDPAQERIIRKVLTAAAAFLLAEITVLEDTIGMRAMVEEIEETVSAELDELLQTAAAASAALLQHAENSTWRTLLPPPVPAPTGAAASVAARTVAIGMWGAGGTGKTTFLCSLSWALLQREISAVRAAGGVPEVWVLGPDPITASLLSELAEHEAARCDARPPLRVHYVWGDSPGHQPGPRVPKPVDGGLVYIDMPGLGVVDGQNRVEALRTCLVAAHSERGVPLDRLIVAGAEHGTAAGPHRITCLDEGIGASSLGLAGCEVTLAGSHTRESLRFWEEQFAAAGARQLSVVGDVRRRGIGGLRRAVTGGATATWNTAAGATASWPTTARAALLMAVCTVGAVVTILALGYAELNGYALLLVLIGVAGMTLTNFRPRWHDTAWFSGRRSTLLSARQREDTTV